MLYKLYLLSHVDVFEWGYLQNTSPDYIFNKSRMF